MYPSRWSFTLTTYRNRLRASTLWSSVSQRIWKRLCCMGNLLLECRALSSSRHRLPPFGMSLAWCGAVLTPDGWELWEHESITGNIASSRNDAADRIPTYNSPSIFSVVLKPRCFPAHFTPDVHVATEYVEHEFLFLSWPWSCWSYAWYGPPATAIVEIARLVISYTAWIQYDWKKKICNCRSSHTEHRWMCWYSSDILPWTRLFLRQRWQRPFCYFENPTRLRYIFQFRICVHGIPLIPTIVARCLWSWFWRYCMPSLGWCCELPLVPSVLVTDIWDILSSPYKLWWEMFVIARPNSCHMSSQAFFWHHLPICRNVSLKPQTACKTIINIFYDDERRSTELTVWRQGA